MIIWNEESSRWLQNASDYTGYSRELSKLLLEYLPEGGTLCDMGCGNGLADFELAPHFREITCVDISVEAIAAVAGRAAELGIRNLTAVRADGQTFEGAWDCVISLFHGGQEAFDWYFRKAKDTLIIAVHSSRTGDLGPENRRPSRCSDAAGMADYLDGRGIHYSRRDAVLEYGQPLTGMEEARRFVAAYTLPMEADELTDYLARNLRETGREDFPYYLPKKRGMGLFVIRRSENPEYD